MEQDRRRDPEGERSGEAGDDLLQRHPGVVGEQAAIGPQRVADLSRGRHEERVEAEGIGDGPGRCRELPGAEQREDGERGRPETQDGSEPAVHAAAPSDFRAAALAATNAGSLIASARAAAGIAGASITAVTAAGRGVRIAARSAT